MEDWKLHSVGFEDSKIRRMCGIHDKAESRGLPTQRRDVVFFQSVRVVCTTVSLQVLEGSPPQNGTATPLS